ncbi:MAG: hypothetical protein ACRCXN_08130 [Bacteroidales bacterium]
MNKKSLYILSFLFLLASLSVLIYIYRNKYENRNLRESFSRIDSISNTDPDKASLFMDSIDNSQLNHHEKNYQMLLNQAIRIEQNIYPKSDSLITFLLFQFLASDDSTNITRAFYLRGLFLQKEGNSLEAASSFINAEDFIPGCKNKKLKYQITSSLADIYSHNKLYQHEIDARERALEYAEDYSDSTAITNSLINLAKAYTNLDSNRVANIDRIRHLIYIIPDSDPEAIPELTKELSTNYEKLGQYDSALYCIDFALSIENNINKKFGYFKVKGNLLEKTGRSNEAIKLYQIASQSDLPEDKSGAYEGLYKIYKQQKNSDSALYYSDKLISLQDSLRRDFTEEALEKLNSIQSYKKQRKAFIENKFEIYRTKALFSNLSITFLIIVIILILINLFYRNRKIKLEISIKEEKAKLFEIELQKREIENQLLREQREKEAEHIRLISIELQQKETENLLLKEKTEKEQLLAKEMIVKAEYYKRLNLVSVPILSASRDNKGFIFLKPADWRSIEENTNACFEHFTDRLAKDYPQLNQDDVRFLCLLKMELSLDLLAAVYHVEKNSISKKKGRLRDKMKIENKTLDEFIRNY